MSTDLRRGPPCSKCARAGSLCSCSGCGAAFCIDHFAAHRTELAAQLDTIQEQHQRLQRIYDHHEKTQEHPLISQIDVWEQDTIAKIQKAARQARDELQRLLDGTKQRLKTIFNRFDEQINSERDANDYTEINLAGLRQKLADIQKQLELPSDIELIADEESPPVHLIKVKSTGAKEDIVTLTSQPVLQPEDVCENVDDQCEEPESSMNEIEDECTVPKDAETSPEQKDEIFGATTPCDKPQIKLRTLLDPTVNNNLILLQLTTIESKLPAIFEKLTDGHLQIFKDVSSCRAELTQNKSTRIIIDICGISSEERANLLNDLSEFEYLYSVYIRDVPPVDDDEREAFFSRYSIISAMFDDEQRLVVQWVLDTVNEYKKTGDIYVNNGDKDKAAECFAEGIALYKRLSIFLDENRRPSSLNLSK